jgi:hypothetical protein
MSVDVTETRNIIEVDDQSSPVVEVVETIDRVEIASNVLTVNGAEVDIIDLKKKVGYSTYWNDPIYSGGKLTQINVYTDDTKTTQLFTQVLTYSGDDIASVVVTDLISGRVLTKTFNGFNLDGSLKPFTRAYS